MKVSASRISQIFLTCGAMCCCIFIVKICIKFMLINQHNVGINTGYREPVLLDYLYEYCYYMSYLY